MRDGRVLQTQALLQPAGQPAEPLALRAASREAVSGTDRGLQQISGARCLVRWPEWLRNRHTDGFAARAAHLERAHPISATQGGGPSGPRQGI